MQAQALPLASAARRTRAAHLLPATQPTAPAVGAPPSRCAGLAGRSGMVRVRERAALQPALSARLLRRTLATEYAALGPLYRQVLPAVAAAEGASPAAAAARPGPAPWRRSFIVAVALITTPAAAWTEAAGGRRRPGHSPACAQASLHRGRSHAHPPSDDASTPSLRSPYCCHWRWRHQASDHGDPRRSVGLVGGRRGLRPRLAPAKIKWLAGMCCARGEVLVAAVAAYRVL